MVQSAQHFYGKVSHVVNGSQYFHQLCKRVVLSAWLLHSALESTALKNRYLPQFFGRVDALVLALLGKISLVLKETKKAQFYGFLE